MARKVIMTRRRRIFDNLLDDHMRRGLDVPGTSNLWDAVEAIFYDRAVSRFEGEDHQHPAARSCAPCRRRK